MPTPTASPRSLPARAAPPVTDAAVAAAVAALGGALAAATSAGQEVGVPGPSAALVAVEAVPLLWRRRAPLTVLAVTLALAWLVALVPAAAFSPMLAAVVAAYTVAAQRRWQVAAAAGAAAALSSALVVRVLLDAPYPFHFSVVPVPDHPLDALAGGILTFGGMTVLGASVRARRAYTASVEERAARLERERVERERRAVLEERARIARELHDVAAHHLSGLVLQAGALERTVERDPERARALAAEVRAGGSSALASMRRLVGILRAADDPDTARGSEPRLGDLDGLVERARADGLDVTLDADGAEAADEAGAEVQLAAYRIVQESLSNARRHAAGARVRVTLSRDDERLSVEVADDGGAAPAPEAVTGPGHGLIGMRERASLLGGELEAGPSAAGGWRVAARLPLRREADA